MADTIFCSNGSIIKLDYNGLSVVPGQFWSAWDSSDSDTAIRNCVIAGDEVIPGDLTANTQYNSCYDCLVDNYTLVYLNSCDNELVDIIVPISSFGFLPIIEQVFYLNIDVNDKGNLVTYTKCFTISNIEQVSEVDYPGIETSFSIINQIIFSNYSLENGCNECLNGFSAGTESELCQICWDGTGYTATVVSAPHPTYTNQFGQAVVQLDAITLGGPNGLNN